MKVGSLLAFVLVVPAIVPALAHAEIYKWKDKDGSIRYSDVPPPSNIKNEPIGKKIPKAGAPAPAAVGKETPDKNAAATKDAAPAGKDDAAAKRAQDAEAQKKADAAKQAELKYKQESCAAARRDLAMYNNGGRIMTTDEHGERKYLGDDEIAKGKTEAQRGVEKFCD